jgi:uncharacterized YigZ family protein
MMFSTIKSSVSADIKVLRSHFIAVLYPVSNPEEARSALSEHVKRYADATHNCYAYLCGVSQETSYYSDAGEPGGTAGKPILNAMLRHGLTNTLAVVTRYYGGIKLGVKGLIDAYGEAVEAAIHLAEFIPARQYKNYLISCEYPVFESLKHKAQELEASIGALDYADEVKLTLSVPTENAAKLIEFIDGYAQHSRLSYKQMTTKD